MYFSKTFGYIFLFIILVGYTFQIQGFIKIPNPQDTARAVPYEELSCTEDHKMRIADIVNTLADHSGMAEIALLAHYPRLHGHEKSLKSCHPLKFIEEFLNNPVLRKRIPEILTGYFTKKGFFGDAYTSGLSQRLNHYHQLDRVECYREGFAKAIHINSETIRPFFDNDDWQGMVEFLIQEMENESL